MSIFVPYDIDSRADKLKQANLKMLQSETIKGDMIIDKNFIFSADQVKVKTIKGNVTMSKFIGDIPEWLKNVKIIGNFNCCNTLIKTFNNFPQDIIGDVLCYEPYIDNLQDMPKYISRDLMLYTRKKFTDQQIRQCCNVRYIFTYNI